MANLTIRIECGNAAFDPEPTIELARILRDIADRVVDGQNVGRVHDINGNEVGGFRLTKRRRS